VVRVHPLQLIVNRSSQRYGFFLTQRTAVGTYPITGGVSIIVFRVKTLEVVFLKEWQGGFGNGLHETIIQADLNFFPIAPTNRPAVRLC
jgi:hypothetical protein